MSDSTVKFNLNGHDHDDVFEAPLSLAAHANIPSISTYHDLYEESIKNPKIFWSKVAAHLHFETPSENGLEWNFDKRKGEVFVNFMRGARTNLSYNCLDRIIQKGHGQKIAYKWEGNCEHDDFEITYQELHEKVVAFAKVLRSRGVRKGDVVAIYMPMIIELPVAMLACSRIGAIHSVIFAGFSSDSLAKRIVVAGCKVLVTVDGFFRGNKFIALKGLAEEAVRLAGVDGHPIDAVVWLEHLKRAKVPAGAKVSDVTLDAGALTWDAAVKEAASLEDVIEWVESEDPLFILYTSGSTGTPKGIVHTTSGYMVYAYETMRNSFDVHAETDVYWCMADCGWITGHTYGVYGPLLNGVTSVIFEGVPSYPQSNRIWAIVEKYGVTKLYTSPTAVRSLMAFSTDLVTQHDRSTLQVIGTVGEPINPAAWKWLYNVAGDGKCAIIDTYWQTETGGHIIAPLPGATATKPGSATLPCVGVVPQLVDNDGAVLEGPNEGNLVLAQPWPGMMRTVWGDHTRYVNTYFSSFPGLYSTGDGARRDEDGYYWITGRSDDLMNVSGHLLSTAEIESALTAHELVVEAAVVAAPHDIKGQTPYCFVTLGKQTQLDNKIIAELQQIVRTKIGAIAMPAATDIQLTPTLPKTRSGKITRRILRKIAEGDQGAHLGDLSTLVDESVIKTLWAGRFRLYTKSG
uniref:Acetyl-coenzyme A synthetase n=1 Tax=Panagrellus redivivus TaxID=6233 RepID=A0A7E4VGH2_PANRE